VFPDRAGPSTGERIAIVAGEASGDLHGAGLVEALRRHRPELAFSGMGGGRMAAAGVGILVDAGETAVVGLTELWEKRRVLRAALQTLRTHLRESRPALLICIDFPDFNLLLARTARRLGIPVCYFISPQVWAWRRGRVRLIRRLVRKMLVLFPFEEPLYRAAGVEVTFVGHPLLDTLATVPPQDGCRARIGVAAEATVLGLLPGSRSAEIRRHLPLLLEAARRVRADVSDVVVLLGLGESADRSAVETTALQSGVGVTVVQGKTPEIIRAADFVLAVSGTVTLEAAVLGTPLLVTYRVGLLTSWLARLLIRVRWAGLPNLIAGRAIVPEFLQNDATPERLAETALRFLRSPDRRAEMRRDLAEVRRRLGEPGALDRAAREIVGLLPARPGREV
jgi:lipid-A-disaccharide synthase